MQDWRTINVSKLTREEACALKQQIQNQEGPYFPGKWTKEEENQMAAIINKSYEITDEEREKEKTQLTNILRYEKGCNKTMIKYRLSDNYTQTIQQAENILDAIIQQTKSNAKFNCPVTYELNKDEIDSSCVMTDDEMRITIGTKLLYANNKNGYVDKTDFAYIIKNVFHETRHALQFSGKILENDCDMKPDKNMAKEIMSDIVLSGRYPGYYYEQYRNTLQELDAEQYGLKKADTLFREQQRLFGCDDMSRYLGLFISRQDEWFAKRPDQNSESAKNLNLYIDNLEDKIENYDNREPITIGTLKTKPSEQTKNLLGTADYTLTDKLLSSPKDATDIASAATLTEQKKILIRFLEKSNTVKKSTLKTCIPRKYLATVKPTTSRQEPKMPELTTNSSENYDYLP